MGYNPEIILAGRRLNDNMGIYSANRVIKLMIHKGHTISGSRVLVLGITFKENCPDIRNSRVIDVIRELTDFECNVDVYDPWADAQEVKHEYGVDLISSLEGKSDYAAIVFAVAHNEFLNLDIKPLKNGNSVVFDIKGFFDKALIDERL